MIQSAESFSELKGGAMLKQRPQEVGLHELGQLTLRANVAYAVRCARRIRPCFTLPAETPQRQEQTAAVDSAIRLAEDFCRTLPSASGPASSAARTAGEVAEATCTFTRFAGYAAMHAVEAAAFATEAARAPEDHLLHQVVAASYAAGRVVTSNADRFTLDIVLAALRHDLETLLTLSHGTLEELGEPIDPSEGGPLGPLWLGEAPSWCGEA
jgi:hypothetical protein